MKLCSSAALVVVAETGSDAGAASPEWWQIVPVAAIISAAVALLIRWMDAPRAVIALEGQYVNSALVNSSPDAIDFDFLLTNSGDGHARDVVISGHLCDVAVRRGPAGPRNTERFVQALPTIAPGESVLVNGYTRREFADRAKVVVTWSHRPGRFWSRLGRRKLAVKPVDMTLAPALPTGGYELTPLPKLFQRWRHLERHTARHKEAE